jgi:hypothetical protein
MPGATSFAGWGYPLPGETVTRQKLQDLADSMHFSLAAYNTDRLSVIQRTRGLIGSTANNVFTVGTVGYMSFNVDHLDNWFNGGRAITATQGPTLAAGFYFVTFYGQITALSAAPGVYTRIDVEIEVAGVRKIRRTLGFGLQQGQQSLRISGPVRLNTSGQVRIRVLGASSTSGATITVGRNNDESSPRLSWVKMAA